MAPKFDDHVAMRGVQKALTVAAATVVGATVCAQGLLSKDLAALSRQPQNPPASAQPMNVVVQSPPLTGVQEAALWAVIAGVACQFGIGLGVLYLTRRFKKADILADFQRRYDSVLDRIYNASSAREPISGLQARLLIIRYWNLQNDQWIAYTDALIDADTFKQWMDDRLLSYQSNAPSFKIAIQEVWDVAGSPEAHARLINHFTTLTPEDRKKVIKNPATKDVTGELALTTAASFFIYQCMTVPDKANNGKPRHSYPRFISHMERVFCGTWVPTKSPWSRRWS